MGKGTSGAGKAGGGNLGAKITGAMATVLVLVTLSTLFSIYAVLALSTAQQPARTGTGTASEPAATQIGTLLSEMQSLAQQFKRQPDPATAVQFDGVNEKLLTTTQAVAQIAKSHNDARLSQTTARIMELLPLYRSSFGKLVQEWEIRGMTGEGGLGHKLTQAVGKLGDPPLPASQPYGLAQALTLLSRAEQNYFAARTPENQRLVSKAITGLKEAANASSLPAPQQQVAQAAIKGYATSFDRYLAVSLATEDPSLSNAFSAEQVRQEEAMHSAALEIEKIIRARNGAQTGATPQSLRQLAQEYLQHGTPDLAAKLESALRDYERNLAEALLPDAEKRALQKGAADVQATFAALVAQDKIIAAQQAAADKDFAALQVAVKEISPTPPSSVAGLPSLPLPLTPRAALLVLGALWLVTVLIVLLLAKNLAASIRAPLRRITDTARRIVTEGDRTLTFPAERHEFAILTAALNELRQQPADIGVPAAGPSQEQLDDLSLRLKDRRDHDVMVAGVVAGQEEPLAQIRSAVATLRSGVTTIRQNLADLKDSEETLPHPSGMEGADNPAPAVDRTTPQDSERLTEVIRDFVDLAEQTSVVALNAAIKSTRTTTSDREFSAVTEHLDRLSRRATETGREINQLLSTLSAGLVTREGAVLSDQSQPQRPESLPAAVAAIDQASADILDSITAVETQIAALDESSSQTGRLLHGLEVMDREISESLSLLGVRALPETIPPSRPDEASTAGDKDARVIGSALDRSIEEADQDERP